MALYTEEEYLEIMRTAIGICFQETDKLRIAHPDYVEEIEAVASAMNLIKKTCLDTDSLNSQISMLALTCKMASSCDCDDTERHTVMEKVWDAFQTAKKYIEQKAIRDIYNFWNLTEEEARLVYAASTTGMLGEDPTSYMEKHYGRRESLPETMDVPDFIPEGLE